MADSKIEMAKLLFDPKIERLLKTFRYSSKTIKEAANELDEKPSRLYYHINKLVKLDLLRVIEEKQINNFIEKYYSSAHTFDDLFAIEGEDAVNNKEWVLNQIMLRFNEGMNVMKADLDSYDELVKENSEGNAKFSILEANLTPAEWKHLYNEMINLIKNRDQKPTEDTNEYSFVLLSYNNDKIKD